MEKKKSRRENMNEEQDEATPSIIDPLPESSFIDVHNTGYSGEVKGRAISNENLNASSSYSPSTVASSGQNLPIAPSTGVVVQNMPNANTVPEFLYQLTKMLTDNNRDTIEWSHGTIEVHNPHKLESHVLNRYFRHSKFASFQRQLNYFGFRKLAGKGKMAPCSYVNEDTGNDIGSLLTIKRKVSSGEPNATKGGKKRDRDEDGTNKTSEDINRVYASISQPQTAVHSTTTSRNTGTIPPTTKIAKGLSFRNGLIQSNPTQQALARVAVGKGVRHNIVASKPSTTFNYATSATPTRDTGTGLEALQNNFRNSLNDLQSEARGDFETAAKPPQVKSEPDSTIGNSSNNWGYVPGSLARNDSLVDLAMIPDISHDSGGATSQGDKNDDDGNGSMPFIDFPWKDFNPDSS